MSLLKPIPILIFTLYATSIVFSGVVYSEAAPSKIASIEEPPSPTMDALERQLEASRHQHLLIDISQKKTPLNAFTTDGCSGGLSAGWELVTKQFPDVGVRHGKLPPWQECCVVHDRAYHAGGAGASSPIESFEMRKQADLKLKACVVDAGIKRSAPLKEFYGLSDNQVDTLYQAISELMYRAVRIGGMPCTQEPWRWGYGWPPCTKVSMY